MESTDRMISIVLCMAMLTGCVGIYATVQVTESNNKVFAEAVKRGCSVVKEQVLCGKKLVEE